MAGASPRDTAPAQRRVAWFAPLEGNACGRAHALTVMSPLRPGWVRFVRFYFGVGRRLPILGARLRRLSFIHFARWTLIDRLPPDPTAQPERLRSTYLLFESNFNGSWSQYIDAFAYVIPGRMRLVWGSSWGFPGPVPAGPFKAYIRRNEFPASHFYSAYPEASVTMIRSALELERRVTRFARDGRGLDPGGFETAFNELLADVQGHL